MKLRSHYVLLGCAIVLPVAVFCGIALTLLQDEQHRSAIARIEETAAQTSQIIDDDIKRADSVLKVLARSHALATGDMRTFHAEATAASAGPGAWIILYGLDGQQVLNTRHDFGAALPFRDDRDTVPRLIASGRGQVSNMRWGAALKNHFVMVETPITSPSGQQFVIGQAFSPQFFSHSFAGRALPPTWRIAILDRNGITIARSSEAQEFVGRQSNPGMLEALTADRSGVHKHMSRKGVEMYDAYTRSGQSDWIVLVGAPVSEINAAVWQGVSMVTLGLVIALLAALTLAVLAGRHLIRFVAQASAAAAALGRGAPIEPLPGSGIRELESLNDAMRDADSRLQREIGSRASAEAQRNALLVLEREARARAEQQNAAKDEFLAMLGHELRNPLSAIASAVAILDRGGTDAASARRARDVLRRQTAHLRKMVDDLLEVNRALMGKLTLDTAPVDLADAARRSIDTMTAGSRMAGFTLHTDLAPVTVDADPARLMQVLDNILDNAIKYSPGGGTIDVRVRRADSRAELVVRDTGQGIAAELLPSVFDIFVQGEQPLQRAVGGLGIGLSLVRRLVEMHGGEVSIGSAGIGHGTTVTVRLPAVDAVAPPSLPAPAMASARRVLLIEDNDDARDMMSMLLAMSGCDVAAAASGPEGIGMARSQAPHIAFIDIGLPGMDGYAIARALKDDPLTAGISLVALTGYGSDDDRRRAGEAGFQHHFTKPISLEDLQLALA